MATGKGVVFFAKGAKNLHPCRHPAAPVANALCPAVTVEQYACTGQSNTNAKKPPLKAVSCAHRVNIRGGQKQG